MGAEITTNSRFLLTAKPFFFRSHSLYHHSPPGLSRISPRQPMKFLCSTGGGILNRSTMSSRLP